MLTTNKNIRWNGGKRRRFSTVNVATDPSPLSSDAIADDYYAVLGLVSFFLTLYY